MKKLSNYSVLALAIGFGFFITSCNNSTTSTTSNTSQTDTSNKMAADTAAKKEAAAPAGKVVNGPAIEVHATGNSMADMKYDVSEMHVKAGSDVKITLVNDATDAAMVHNIVIVKPEDADSVAAEGMRAGMKNNFVPDDKARVIAASKLTQPGTKTEVSFKAPAKGDYLFMCTYPGHYTIMRGKFIVE